MYSYTERCNQCISPSMFSSSSLATTYQVPVCMRRRCRELVDLPPFGMWHTVGLALVLSSQRSSCGEYADVKSNTKANGTCMIAGVNVSRVSAWSSSSYCRSSITAGQRQAKDHWHKLSATAELYASLVYQMVSLQYTTVASSSGTRHISHCSTFGNFGCRPADRMLCDRLIHCYKTIFVF